MHALPIRSPLLAFCACLSASTPGLASDAIGSWRTEKGRVSVSECGGALCATVTGIDQPNDPRSGKPVTDQRNPDAALRTRPVMGIAVLIGMKPANDGGWKGSIYNPEDGKTYAATMKLEGNRLKVTGCVASLVCRTQVWTR